MGNCQNSTPVDNSKTIEKEKKGKHDIVTVRSKTWSRNSHGLFDYEATDVYPSEFKLKYPGFLYRRENNSVIMKQDNENPAPEETEILKVLSQDGQLWVDPFPPRSPDKTQAGNLAGDSESNEKLVWIVVKSLKETHLFSRGYRLKEKDLIKLGRVRFRVKEICVDSKKKTALQDEFHKGPVFVAHKPPSLTKLNESQRNIPVCRICLCEGSEDENPLVNPCRCAGTMKYVHIKCLQQWLKSRLHTRDTAISFTIAWKNLDCELCKKAFPSVIEFEGARYYPLELPRTDAESYIIFEVLSKDSTQVRGLHFINLSLKPTIKLGRGHESDVRIADISVSRCHATLQLDKGSVYLADNDSKFGTLVQLKHKFPLMSELNNITVQVGRTAMTFNVATSSKTSLTMCLNPSGLPQLNAEGISPNAGNNGSPRLENMDFDLNKWQSQAEADEMKEEDLEELREGNNNNNDDNENILAGPIGLPLNGLEPNRPPVNANIEELLYDNNSPANHHMVVRNEADPDL